MSVDSNNKMLVVPANFWSMKPELAINLTTNDDTADFSQNLEL